MSSRRDGQPWLTAIIRTSALKNVGAIRSVDLTADAAPKLVRGCAEISSRLTSATDDDLTVAIHVSDLRRSVRFLHRAIIVAPMQAIENV
jgi:hypothetical protein